MNSRISFVISPNNEITIADKAARRKRDFGKDVASSGRVIAGWDIGVAQIPPELTCGYPGTIPPDATLVFEVALLSIN